MKKEQPQFAFWDLVLQLELCLLDLIHSFRTSDFLKYIQSLSALIPWMFALDHTHYARWLSVHIRDMHRLQKDHPEVFREFCSGAFVVQKTKRKFSTMALDQVHEQCNATVKGDGGVVGLTANASALRRWMIAGPELSRLIREFEQQIPGAHDSQSDHHDQILSVQKAFKSQVQALVTSFEELGNPFQEDSGFLIALDSKNIMPQPVIDTVYKVKEIGQDQFKTFVEERIVTQSKPVSEPIKRNNLARFSSPGPKAKNIPKTGIAALKNDCSLFSRLYIACQSRDGDLENFFKHENQPWPPSLFKLGELRTGKKADIIRCLTSQGRNTATLAPSSEENVQDTSEPDDLDLSIDDLIDFSMCEELMDMTDPGNLLDAEDGMGFAEDIFDRICQTTNLDDYPTVDAKVLDGAAIVQMLIPKVAKTFQDYADNVFIPYILRQLETVSRIDVVWDLYLPGSLKAATREKRGSGLRRRVSPKAAIPGNWKGFLRVDENKEELFQLLATKLETE